MEYPQYRKYLNERSYFKIISPTEWEEIQIIGTKQVLNTFKVNIMPDRNFLHDMTFDYKANWLAIGADEYEQKKALL